MMFPQMNPLQMSTSPNSLAGAMDPRALMQMLQQQQQARWQQQQQMMQSARAQPAAQAAPTGPLSFQDRVLAKRESAANPFARMLAPFLVNVEQQKEARAQGLPFWMGG